MKTHVLRLKKNDDLLLRIKEFCAQSNIGAGVVLSSVGCVSKASVRDAGGVYVKTINENLEIISLNGTVSKDRVHLHISFSKEDLSVIGGHLVEGCIINTTCELCILELEEYKFSKIFDETTGYNELKILKKS